MLIFGFGITLDIDNLKFAVLDHDQSPESRAYIDQFAQSSYFMQMPTLASEQEGMQQLQRNRVALFIEIPPRFGADLHRSVGTPQGKSIDVAVTIDGAMPFRAETVLGYLQGVNQLFISEYAARAGISIEPAATLEMRFRYNQSFRSIDAMVPEVIALLLVFIPPILTALGVVTEKELGSITNLYVTPVTRLEFLLGKQAPYAALALFNFMVVMLMAVFVFGVIPKGSVLGLTMAATAYVLATSAIGLVTSALTKTQVAALFVTALITIIPAVQYCGLLQPVATMKGIPYLFGTLFPTTACGATVCCSCLCCMRLPGLYIWRRTAFLMSCTARPLPSSMPIIRHCHRLFATPFNHRNFERLSLSARAMSMRRWTMRYSHLCWIFRPSSRPMCSQAIALRCNC